MFCTSDFSSEADAKHERYLKDRVKYLEKCKVCKINKYMNSKGRSEKFHEL